MFDSSSFAPGDLLPYPYGWNLLKKISIYFSHEIFKIIFFLACIDLAIFIKKKTIWGYTGGPQVWGGGLSAIGGPPVSVKLQTGPFPAPCDQI